MNKYVTVSLPLNVTELEMPLFEPFLTYELAPQKVKRFKNVFVGYSGFCMNNKGLIKESHHDHPHQYDDYQSEAARYYYDVTDHPDHLITLDDDNTYLLIHHPWYNYYHWILECIFRAWMVKDKKDEMILLLPDYYGESDFIMGSLEPFKFKNIFFIPSRKSLMVKNLCLPQIKAKVDSYDYKMIAQVRQFYLDYVLNEKKIAIDLGERIYISRKKASRKKVENEADIETILLKYHFTILNNEDYNFLEQVAIYSQAKYLVSIHGSGLTNMLFMKEGSGILEFHKKQTNDKDWHSKAFWYQAEALGFNYYQQMCEPTDLNDDYFNANFIVDPQLLEKNLALMCS
jgi:capsular polysaccharide biosynthesis protein